MENSVRVLEPSDWPWVERVFKQHAKMLGNFFWMKQSYEKGRGRIWVVPEIGFIHLTYAKEGITVIQDIAIEKNAQRGGHGKALLSILKGVIKLKTDAENIQSNAFYKKYGFKLVGQVKSRKGKPINIYMRWP